MSPLAVSVVVLVCIFGSSVIGLLLRPRFPDEHLNAESREVVKLVIGIVGTMTGMVLGLLVASAKSSFDSQTDGVAQLAANTIVLDRTLKHYGAEAREARDALRTTIADMMHRMWPGESSSQSPKSEEEVGKYEEVYERILALQPKTEAQHITQSQALKIIYDTAQMRWLLYSQKSSSIPFVFLALMVAWLCITFASYGLFAPRHTTAFAVLLLGSVVVSSAVFLIQELENPFGGVMHISSQPLQHALLQIGK